MKKFIFIMSFIFSALTILAMNNPFLEIYRKHFPFCGDNIKYINSFVGDSIYFDIQGNYALHNVFQEIPDTIWLKEKKTKKPKEGKDYILCYNYKGIPNEKSFYTPASAFDKQTFSFLSVKEKGSFLSENINYDLSLIDPKTANVIHVILDKSLPTNWRLYSRNSNAIIDNWIGKHFYKRTYYDLTEYILTFGELYLEFELNRYTPCLSPHGEFILTSEISEPLNLTYDSDFLSHDLELMTILSQSEYENEMDKKKVYSINYELPNDSILKKKLELLPFKTIMGKTNGYSCYVSQTIEPGSFPLGFHTIPNNTYVLIGDKITVRDKDYYKAVLHGKSFFIKCSEVNIEKPELLDTLLTQPQDIRDAFFDFAKIASRYRYLEERLENLTEFQKLSGKGLMVLEAYPYDMSEYTDGTGMKFRFLNTSKKTIKYITVNFIGYNAVDDPVTSEGKTLLTVKGIGPIDPFETGYYDFEYVWFSDIVEYSKVRSIVVQYTNGTSKTFTGESVKVVPDKIKNLSFASTDLKR